LRDADAGPYLTDGAHPRPLVQTGVILC
jgi:hypothetical protein